VRLLIVAFYFPPTGGGGVQRTLKFCKFLPEFGIDVHVLAPEDSKWFARDEQLLRSVPQSTTVHRCRFVGPRSSFHADAVRGRRGLGRIGVEARYAYQRALIPDKATPWMATALPAGIGIVRRERIDVVMSTSPPTSAHLVAEAIASATRRPFVADFRDSWLDNPHRRYEKAGVRAKRSVIARLASSVGRRSAGLVAATGTIAQELGRMHPSAAHKTTVIENGADFDDFEGLPHERNQRFTIVHAGSFFGQRTPGPFLLALERLLERRPELRGRLLARFIGEMRAADALLLLIPHADGRGDSVLSGKVFEYVASRRPILAAVPPNGAAANLIRGIGAGVVVDGDDAAAISRELELLVDRWLAGGSPDIELTDEVRDRLSRRSRARELARVLDGVAG
jgi:glycosyltransferase involved in cell wall biosynthesis